MPRRPNGAFQTALVALFALLLVVSAAPTQARQADVGDLAVDSVGLLDADGTVLYSVILTGRADLQGLTVTGYVPAGTRLVEVVQTPEGTEATGEIAVAQEAAEGVSWAVATLPIDTVLGPFTYRVEPTGADSELPAAALAEVRWDGGAAQTDRPEGALRTLADSGTITIDADGTEGLVEVGGTGVLLQVPPDAVAGPTTLTFTRLPIEGSSLLPEDTNLWWCALWQIEAESPARFSQPVRLALPARKVLTPGLPAVGFVDGGEDATTTGIVPFPGTHVETHLVELGEIDRPIVMGQGVGSLARTIAATSVETAIAEGDVVGDVVGDSGVTSVSSTSPLLSKTCRGLLANMNIFNRQYWDAVERGDPIAAQYNRESYYANRHAWDSLNCGKLN